MWHDVASVQIKLEVAATQCHCCERPALGCWCSVSNVRFLFGLTTYCSFSHDSNNDETNSFKNETWSSLGVQAACSDARDMEVAPNILDLDIR
jgi:hypothetical protein